MNLRILNDLTIYTPVPKPPRPQEMAHSAPTPSTDDNIDLQPVGEKGLRAIPQTRLINEQREELSHGVRHIRTFEQADGRTFTRAEEIILTQSGARRAVVQQNPSGGITRYEEVLDREESGTFRRTQRFQDEAGEVSTQISNGYQVTDPFILTGSGSFGHLQHSAPFQPMRGTQLDLRA